MEIKTDYEVVKPFGKFKKGERLRIAKRDHLRCIKRKLQENDGTVKEWSGGQKMTKDKPENKMIEKSEENKSKK